MKSMTGYGSSQTKNRQLEIEVHVKSVNGRFLEPRFHLPKEYAPFENDLRKIFGDQWSRGTLDIYVHRRPSSTQRLGTVEIRKDSAQYWAKTLKSLAKDLGLRGELTLKDILQMPYVMEHQDRVSLMPGELKLVHSVLKKAADQCLQFREREGKSLKKELLSQIKALENCLVDMEHWREEALKSSEQRLKSRLAALDSPSMDPSRLALETALIVDKMDVHEEMVRLGEHIKACRGLIQSSDSSAKGKQLDFYCQELLREVNTVGSKSQLASLTQVVVSAKSTIEKFREQVQNVE